MSRPNIVFDDVVTLLRKWGIDPNQAFHVEFNLDGVIVDGYQLNKDGKKFTLPDGQSLAKQSWYRPRFRDNRGRRGQR